MVSLAGRKLYRERYDNLTFKRALHFLKQSAQFSKAEMDEYITDQLQALIQHAYNTVPYYNELFSKLNLTPSDIVSVEDLEILPILTKEEVRTNRDKMLSSTTSYSNLVPAHTSGTTGTPLSFWWTKEGAAWEFAFVWARGRDGVSFDDPFATFNSRMIAPINQQNPPFWRHNRVLRQTLFSIYHMNDDTLPQYLRMLNESNFRYYVGYPSAIYTIASYMLEHGTECHNPPIKVFARSETLDDWQRSSIEKAFDTSVHDSYSNGEQSVLITQCKYGNYHVNYEYSIVEFIPISVQEDCTLAKVVGTGFLNMAMPFIRYDTGDCVEIKIGGAACPCGRLGPVITKIHGREDDLIVTPTGNVVGRISRIFRPGMPIRESQIVQHEDGSLELIIVRQGDHLRDLEDQLLDELQQRLGESMSVRFTYTDSIPRTSSGKFRGVISHYRPRKSWLRTTRIHY
jgi:phenylacetate-CoA ligase